MEDRITDAAPRAKVAPPPYSRWLLAVLGLVSLGSGGIACSASDVARSNSGKGGATGAGGRRSGSGGTGEGGSDGAGGESGVGGGPFTGAGGGSGTGGASGRPGTTDAGPPTDGPAPDDKAAAAVLDGYAILKPCVSTFTPTPNPNGDCCCEELAANENQHNVVHFGGDPSVTYNVTVRVAGIAERYWYAGGALDPASKLFYVGGLPTIHSAAAPNANLAPGKGACKIHPPQTDGSFALPFVVPPSVNPSDGCYNGFNVFALVVSSPRQSYYLNDTTDFDGVDRQPHKVYKNDYVVTFPITGQSQLDFFTIDGDHHQVTNDGTMTVPNVKTPQPYNGNFLEFAVMSVTRAH